MSEQQKAPIRDVQVDEILAQVEKKRASHGGKTPKASEAQLDAILKSMGLGERKRPRYSEPILLPSPVQEDARGSAAPAPGSAAAWNRAGRSGLNTVTGLRYVKGRMFYSWTKMKAMEHALDAANEALEIFAEEKGV